MRPSPETSGDDISRSGQAVLGAAVDAPAAAFNASVVASLQRTAGNAAVASLLRDALAVDEVEFEEPSPVLDIVGKGRGEPLQAGLRQDMEARLGADFSDVRIHTDGEAARSAAAVSARAYTVGNDVVFGTDAPALDTGPGHRTLAHELTHVIQQRSGPVEGVAAGGGISISDPSDRFETAAEANALRAMSQTIPAPAAVAAPVAAQRQIAAEEAEDQAEEYQEEAAEYEDEAVESAEEAVETAEEEGGEEEEEEGEGEG